MATDRYPKMTIPSYTQSERVPKAQRKKLRASLSFNSLARLDQSLSRDMSAGNLSQYSIGSDGIIEVKNKIFITRNELETDLNVIKLEIAELKKKMEQQELEQQLTHFQLIKKLLVIYQLWLSIITIYQTFKLEYNELIIESEIKLEKPNMLELLMILYRALPYILTKTNCLKSIRKSILFIIAFMFISRKTELYRNIGFIISTCYSF
eukprot:14787_1